MVASGTKYLFAGVCCQSVKLTQFFLHQDKNCPFFQLSLFNRGSKKWFYIYI